MRNTGFVPDGECVGERRGHQAPVVVEAPNRHVALARRHQLAKGDFGIRVGAQEPGAGDQAARLAEIGQHRALVGALLEAAVELGEGDDGRLELAGEDLEVPADLGDLDLAALGVAAAGHELDVVDDDDAELAELAA